jgi:glycosyltransferase involved in cell wall biosynthesis
VPEIFTAPTGRALPRLLAGRPGPRVALFHDALALQFPEFTSPSTVARFPSYLQQLLQFDGIAAVSEASRTALVDYWRWLGVARTPPVVALPLGMDRPPPPSAVPAAPEPLILCVSTLEGRKNHLSLLEACESLWAGGSRFHLRLIGLTNRRTGAAAAARIAQLQAAGRPIRYDGPVADPVLEQAYAACTFTVYPSVAEGFGLPVAESLLRGKPCLCRLDGALGEIARPGGCASIGQGAAPDIAAAIHTLLVRPEERAALEQAARRRTFRTWSQYVAELRSWMKSLPLNA